MADPAPPTVPAAAKKPRPPPTGPNMYAMLLDAITNLTDRKGATLPAIKNYIMEKYPNADNGMLRSRLKKAVAKGMEKGIIVRPKNAEAAGASMTGRFRLDKAAFAKETKVKTKSDTDKPKKKTDKSDEKKKKAAKSPKATKSPKTKKSPKAPKAAKSPKAKKSPKKKPSIPKSPKAKTAVKAKKSPSAKKPVAKTKKVAEKTKKPKAKTTKSPGKKATPKKAAK